MKRVICLALMLLALMSPALSLAEMILTVSCNGDGSFVLAGGNVSGVRTVDLTVGYDTTFLGNPQVGLQGGAVTNVAGTPGRLAVNIVREDPDAGLEVELNFETKGDGAGVINYVAASMTDTDGRRFPVRAVIVPFTPAPDPAASPAPEGKESVATPAVPPVGSAGSSPRGTVGEERKAEQPERTKNGDDLEKSGADEASKQAASDNAVDSMSAADTTVQKSVLQRFREFRGRRGLKEFAALFERGKGEGIRQEPAIARANGRTPVEIELDTKMTLESAPNFALSDAKFVSLHREGGTKWLMTVVPNEGACEVRLILRAGGNKVEFPLVVVPPVDISEKVDRVNFLSELNKYLAEQTTGEATGSPSRQYLHEYIFTANYLASTTGTKTVR